MIFLTLPMAPSVNHYYGNRARGGKFIKPAGVAFRKEVARTAKIFHVTPMLGRLALEIRIYPATCAKQDLDNRLKSLLDALTHAGVWIDDSQIDRLTIERGSVVKGGGIEITITEIAK